MFFLDIVPTGDLENAYERVCVSLRELKLLICFILQNETFTIQGLFTWRWGNALRLGNPPAHIVFHYPAFLPGRDGF